MRANTVPDPKKLFAVCSPVKHLAKLLAFSVHVLLTLILLFIMLSSMEVREVLFSGTSIRACASSPWDWRDKPPHLNRIAPPVYAKRRLCDELLTPVNKKIANLRVDRMLHHIAFEHSVEVSASL